MRTAAEQVRWGKGPPWDRGLHGVAAAPSALVPAAPQPWVTAGLFRAPPPFQKGISCTFFRSHWAKGRHGRAQLKSRRSLKSVKLGPNFPLCWWQSQQAHHMNVSQPGGVSGLRRRVLSLEMRSPSPLEKEISEVLDASPRQRKGS